MYVLKTVIHCIAETISTFVTRFAKGVLYTHSFRSHFSLSFDRYNNRPTVHACTIAKSSTVCFNEASFMGLSGVHGCSGGL